MHAISNKSRRYKEFLYCSAHHCIRSIVCLAGYFGRGFVPAAVCQTGCLRLCSPWTQIVINISGCTRDSQVPVIVLKQAGLSVDFQI